MAHGTYSAFLFLYILTSTLLGFAYLGGTRIVINDHIPISCTAIFLQFSSCYG